MADLRQVPVLRDLAQLLASVLGAVAVARLMEGAGGATVLWPLLSCACLGWLVPAGFQRWRRPAAAAVVAGTLVVAVAALWTSVPGTTSWPTGRTLHLAAAALRGARPELRAFVVPLHPIHGVLFLGALGVGLVALFQRLLLGSASAGRYTSLASLAGTLVLVAWSVTARGGRGDLLLVASFGVVVFLALIGSTDAGVAGRRPSRPTIAVGATAVLASVVVVLVPIASAAPTAGSTLVAPTGLSLTSRLVDLEARDPDVVLFTARTSVPTYWQVAVLSQLRNGVFVPGSDVAGLLSDRSSAVPAPPPVPAAGTKPFTASVSIAHLSSRLLPAPPGTFAVTADPPAVLTSSAVVAPHPTAPGATYSVLAAGPLPTSVLVSAAGEPPAAVTPAQSQALAPFVALPTEPQEVHTLALEASQAGSNPLTKAEALVDYFRSGRFGYTLVPPEVPKGVNPLLGFLTVTRRGNCEQFAGAFTVLARSVGLPTRLVVGFTAGERSGSRTVVRGQDAHAWPEVYLGQALGWVSFEPTPSQAPGEQSAQGVLGPIPLVAPRTSVTPTSPTTAPTPTTAASSTPTTATTSSTPATTATTSAPTVTGTGGSATGTLPLVLGILAACLAAVAFGLWARRRNRRRRSAATRVTHAWRSVEHALRRAGVPRPAGRSPSGHTRRLLEAAGDAASAGIDQVVAVLTDLAELADRVEPAAYGPGPVTLDDAATAESTASRVRQGLRSRPVTALLRQLAATVDAPNPREAGSATALR